MHRSTACTEVDLASWACIEMLLRGNALFWGGTDRGEHKVVVFLACDRQLPIMRTFFYVNQGLNLGYPPVSFKSTIFARRSEKVMPSIAMSEPALPRSTARPTERVPPLANTGCASRPQPQPWQAEPSNRRTPPPLMSDDQSKTIRAAYTAQPAQTCAARTSSRASLPHVCGVRPPPPIPPLVTEPPTP